MAFDTAEVKRVYRELMGQVADTLDTYVNDSSIKSEDKAKMVSETINNTLNKSIDSLLIAEQIKTEKNQTLDVAAATALKAAQTTLTASQKATEDKQTLDVAAATKVKDTQVYTEKIKQKRQYGATVNAAGTIAYETDGKSVVEKQVAGFDMSNFKSLNQSYQQAVGMIYNSGNEVPAYYVDAIKKTTELLSGGKIDFTKVGEETKMTTGTSWE